MALDLYQQVYNFFGSSKNILIIAGKKTIEDSYPAALALKKILTNNERKAAIFSSCEIPPQIKFLADAEPAQKPLACAQRLAIKINAPKNSIRELSYKKTDSELHIYIAHETPGPINEHNIRVDKVGFEHDLIVTLGTEDLGALGSDFESNAQFFYETPIINIDENSANERYGEVNLIEPLASSCSEIVSSLIKKWDETLITKEVSTPLFAGIAAATCNFQNGRTKPSTLYEAAFLLSREAEQTLVVKNLFKTRPLEVIRLCGIAMASLNIHKNPPLAWVIISKDDFARSGTGETAVPFVVSELKNNFAGWDTLIVFFEAGNSFRAVFYTSRDENTDLLNELLGVEIPNHESCAQIIEDITRKIK